MNFSIVWIKDKFGFVPKDSVDFQEWPFPVPKKTVKKTVKIPKATTRKKPTTKK